MLRPKYAEQTTRLASCTRVLTKFFRVLRGTSARNALSLSALALLSSCALTVHGTTAIANARQCPIPVTAVIMDTLLGAAAFGVSAIKWEANKPAESLAYTSLGMVVLGGSLYAEITCMRSRP